MAGAGAIDVIEPYERRRQRRALRTSATVRQPRRPPTPAPAAPPARVRTTTGSSARTRTRTWAGLRTWRGGDRAGGATDHRVWRHRPRQPQPAGSRQV